MEGSTFDLTTLLVFPTALAIPILIIIVQTVRKKWSVSSYMGIAYGAITFLASLIALFVAGVLVVGVFFNEKTFESGDEGMNIIAFLLFLGVAFLYFVCETGKYYCYKHFLEKKAELVNGGNYDSIGVSFALGVMLMQSIGAFVILNVMDVTVGITDEQLLAGYKLGITVFMGTLITVIGFIYILLSQAAWKQIERSAAVLYIISSLYYLIWVFIIIFANARYIAIFTALAAYVFSVIISLPLISDRFGKVKIFNFDKRRRGD